MQAKSVKSVAKPDEFALDASQNGGGIDVPAFEARASKSGAREIDASASRFREIGVSKIGSAKIKAVQVHPKERVVVAVSGDQDFFYDTMGQYWL